MLSNRTTRVSPCEQSPEIRCRIAGLQDVPAPHNLSCDKTARRLMWLPSRSERNRRPVPLLRMFRESLRRFRAWPNRDERKKRESSRHRGPDRADRPRGESKRHPHRGSCAYSSRHSRQERASRRCLLPRRNRSRRQSAAYQRRTQSLTQVQFVPVSSLAPASLAQIIRSMLSGQECPRLLRGEF